MNNNKCIIISVGDYVFNFSNEDVKFSVKLDAIQEDNIIHSKNGKFLVLRNATFNIEDYHKLISVVGINGFTIKSKHECVLFDDDSGNIYNDFISRFTNCTLLYVLLENKCGCAGVFKVVFKFDESSNEAKNKNK